MASFKIFDKAWLGLGLGCAPQVVKKSGLYFISLYLCQDKVFNRVFSNENDEKQTWQTFNLVYQRHNKIFDYTQDQIPLFYTQGRIKS